MTERYKPILCVDFDGVIHSYTSGWKGETIIPDPPVKGALRWLWEATEWWNVQIYSSRSKSLEARQAMKNWMLKYSLTEFGEDHPMSGGTELYPIDFAHEKPSAFLTIDDRAICFEGDWHDLNAADLLGFKPWNKREVGATGTFPMPAINDDDQGALQIGVAYDKLDGLVHLNFGKPVAWTAFPPEMATQLARTLLKHAGAKTVEISF
jgi:hypothetical protein